jgi:hypothetical protein
MVWMKQTHQQTMVHSDLFAGSGSRKTQHAIMVSTTDEEYLLYKKFSRFTKLITTRAH